MHPRDYINFFNKVVFIAEEHRRSPPRGRYIEPGYFAVLMYLKCAPLALQKEAEQRLVRRVASYGGRYKKGSPSLALISYCMRELKWERVRQAAIKRKNDREIAKFLYIRLRLALEKLISAYEQEWDLDLAYDYHKYRLPNIEQSLINYKTKHWGAKAAAEAVEFERRGVYKSMFPEDYILILQKIMVAAEEASRLSKGGAKASEPGYFAVTAYVKESTSPLRKMAEREFVKMLELRASDKSSKLGFYRLMAYCMRELRFSAVRSAAARLKIAPQVSGRRQLFLRRAMDEIIKACESK